MRKPFRFFCLFSIMLVCLSLISCGKEADGSTSDSIGTSTPDSASHAQTSSVETSVSLPESSAPATDTPAAEPVTLLYQEAVVSKDGCISIPSASFISGTLLHIEEGHPYRFGISSLIPNDDISGSALEIKGQNLMILYGNKSSDYRLATARLFMKSDAFACWEALLARFRADTGKTSLQVVESYLYNGEASLEDPFVTGYSVAVNLYENNATYSLASENMSVTVNGKTVTCLSWFLDHCAEYGFVYTGLTGNYARTLATFRYVGRVHALAMQLYDIIDMKEYNDLIQREGAVVLTEPSGTKQWTIRYYPADSASDDTVIPLPVGAVYTVSGNNLDGFIVAYYLPDGADMS